MNSYSFTSLVGTINPETSAVTPASLSGEGVFTGRVALLQRFNLAVLHHKLIDGVRELWSLELQTFDRDEFDRRPTRECERKSVPPLIKYLELDVSGCQVISRELFEKRCIQSLGLPRENHFSLIQRNPRVINVPLRIGPEIDGELAVLLVFGCIESIIMEMVHRKLERVKMELQLVLLQPDLENAVRRIFILSRVVRQRVRWFGVRNAVGAGLRACFRAGLLACESLLQPALAPGCLIQAQQPLVHVIADDVIQGSAVIADHQDDHADLVVGQEGNLRVEPGKVPAVEGEQSSPVRSGLSPHAVGWIQQLPVSECFAKSVWQTNGRLHRGFQHVRRQDLLSVVSSIIHQRDEPVRHVLDIRNYRARGSHPLGVLVVGDLVQLKRVALLPERHSVVRILHHVGDRIGGRAQVQRLEDSLPHKLLPRLSGFQFDDVPGSGEHQVVVQERFAHRLLRLEVFQLFEQLLPFEIRFEPDRIVPGHTRPVRQHVSQSNVVIELVVVELDRRDGLAHALIPTELSFLYQHPRRNRGEQFRVRSDLAQRRRSEGQLLLVVPVPIPLDENQLVIDYDAYTNPRRIPILQDLFHVGVEPLQLVRDLPVLRPNAKSKDHYSNRQGEHANRATG